LAFETPYGCFGAVITRFTSDPKPTNELTELPIVRTEMSTMPR
jgi:hypothetical protein